MIWVSRKLKYFVEKNHPEQVAETVNILGTVYRLLTPQMFGALYQHMRSQAHRDALTAEDVRRFTALEHTIHALGQEGEYYADVTKNA